MSRGTGERSEGRKSSDESYEATGRRGMNNGLLASRYLQVIKITKLGVELDVGGLTSVMFSLYVV